MIKFGTGGWRAIIGDDFIRENIVKVATGLAKVMKEENKMDKPVMVGFDRRFLSEPAAKWIAQTLAANGIDVWFTGRSTPTPLVMFICKEKQLHFGVEVTASHNPADYNGIKLFVHDGRDAPIEFTERVEELIANLTPEDIKCMPFDEAVAAGKITYPKDLFNEFVDSIMARLDMNAIRKRGPRILFNPMHGSGSYPLNVLLHIARCTVDTINSNKDAFFGGSLPAPAPDTLYEMAKQVQNGHYDLGIAVDGDGDRLGIIDPNGMYVDANQILCMLYYYLHEYRGWKGPVVRNLATTHMLDAMAASFGEECYEVPVGFKWVSSKLEEKDAVLGGESSGGLTVRGHIFGKDSIYAAALFVEMMSATGKSPVEFYAELTEKYGHFEMAEDNLHFRMEEKDRIVNLLMVEKKLPDFGKKVVRVNYEDGCKVYFEDNSFVICRFSGTEPLLRIFAEADERANAQKLIDCMKKFVNV